MRESFDLAGYPLLTNIMAPAALPLTVSRSMRSLLLSMLPSLSLCYDVQVTVRGHAT
jgi:hypothetical protein